MLHLLNLEEIEALLLRVPALVKMQDQRSSLFPDSVRAWLVQLERCLEANRLPEVSQVATFRSSILAAERGLVPENMNFRGRPTRSKIASAVSGTALKGATDVAFAIVGPNRARFVEAVGLVRQMVAVAQIAMLLPADPPSDREAYLAAVRQQLLARPELAPGMIRVEGLVGPHDALIVLDRVLTADTARIGERRPALN